MVGMVGGIRPHLATSSTSPSAPAAASTPAAAENAPEPAPEPAAQFHPRDITIRQAVSGLAGAIATAGIETVGNTASSLVRLPQATFQAYKTLINTPQIGPVLKTAIALTLPVGALAAPVLTAIGSAGFGLFHGADVGVEKGFSAACQTGTKDVKRFDQEISGTLVQSMKSWETEPLPAGQKPFDIHPAGAVKGLAAGLVGAVVDGAGMGALTLARTPQGIGKAFSEIKNSEQGPVLKTTESLLVLPAATLAAPLALVGGALVGLVSGSAEGYKNGFISGADKTVHYVKEFNDGVNDMLRS